MKLTHTQVVPKQEVETKQEDKISWDRFVELCTTADFVCLEEHYDVDLRDNDAIVCDDPNFREVVRISDDKRTVTFSTPYNGDYGYELQLSLDEQFFPHPTDPMLRGEPNPDVQCLTVKDGVIRVLAGDYDKEWTVCVQLLRATELTQEEII